MPKKAKRSSRRSMPASSMSAPMMCNNCDNCANCCMSWSGIIHVTGGVGAGFLLVHYLKVPDLDMFGWAFVVLALVGHVVFWTKK